LEENLNGDHDITESVIEHKETKNPELTKQVAICDINITTEMKT